MTSSSIGIPRGRLATPITSRTDSFLDAKDISKQVRDSVRDPGLVEEVSGGRHEHAEPNNARDSIERAQMLFRRGEGAQGRSVGGISSSFGIELFPQPAKIFRLVVDNRKHPAKEEQVARLQCLDVSAKRRRGGWELNAKVLQPALGAARLRTFSAYHRPTCAPPSTCSTSPVT